MATMGIKGFYRQKKGVAKPFRKRSTAGKSKAAAAAFASALDPEQFQIQGSDDGKVVLVAAFEEENEEKLRQFDLDMRYGPCIGLSRVERWDRATAMGLNPPDEVEAILLKLSYAAVDCLWGRRI